MKKTIILLVSLVFVFACTEEIVSVGQTKKELMDVDRQFSAMSIEKGQVEAFLSYMDEEVVLYPQKGIPVEGKRAFERIAETTPRSEGTLEWEPFFADVSKSGDLGYTLGKYKLTTPGERGDDVKYGYYCSIWKKQMDGSWKFVFDGGNESPPHDLE